MDPLAGEHLTRIDGALRIDRDHMQPVELAAAIAHAPHLTHDLAILAIEEPDVIVRQIGNIQEPLRLVDREHHAAGGATHACHGSQDEFLHELDKVWSHCFRALTPGGRLVCVVGDVCLSRRENGGRHTVVPLHASIQEHCRKIGFDNLSPIIWHKISNAVHEVENGSGFLGKPYEPNAVIKNDIEFILMQRKPGGYRAPDISKKVLSLISANNHKKWFQQIWTGVTGASTKHHPAPYPPELAERLVRMFSFVGDTVLDPFLGTGTTTVSAAKWGRNSIGFEVDSHYFKIAQKRIADETASLFNTARISALIPD